MYFFLVKFITKCDGLFYYKVGQLVITKCDSYFITNCDTVLLQSAPGITKCDEIITKCDDYYTECDRTHASFHVCEVRLFLSIVFCRIQAHGISIENVEKVFRNLFKQTFIIFCRIKFCQ